MTACIDNGTIGFIEAKMNELMFKPPKRNLSKLEKPTFIETIETIETFLDARENENISLSYFVIHPSDKDKKDKPYILWSHGNGCDIIETYPEMKDLHSKLNGQIGIIMYDYEGYGLSSGKCRETNCYRNLSMMIDLCKNTLNISANNLFLLGHSLGTGVVIDYVANHTDWETPIILISPYKSISRVLVDPHWTDLLTNFVVNCVDRFVSIDKIEKITSPIYIYHGMKDTLIDYHHSIELRKKNKGNTTLILMKHANHNDMLRHINPKEIWNIIFNYKNTILESK